MSIEIKKRIEPVLNRVLNLVARGVYEKAADEGELQTGQISLLADEISDDAVERFGQYGFASHPHPQAEAVVLHIGGNRDHGIIIACEDRRYRLKPLQAGEVALYTDEGDFIKLARGNRVQIKTASLTIDAGGTQTIIDGGGISTAGEIKADGNISTSADLSVSGSSELTGDVSAGANLDVAGDARVTGAASVSGDLSSEGEVSDSDGELSRLRKAYNEHDHNYTDTPSGPSTTQPPSKTV